MLIYNGHSLFTPYRNDNFVIFVSFEVCGQYHVLGFIKF
jgi:hypothetical protein